ncbi:MAG: 30S ribosomal protein S9 [Planctomycetes bacterium]|nr:30S ribosomal protein S9 [Planctomycetota bacterium]
MAVNNPYVWGTGRRKTATARVRIKPGTGKLTINGRDFEQYFVTDDTRRNALQPLVTTETRNNYDIAANVTGGGPIGQAGAVSLGIARALRRENENFDKVLRDNGLLTRDSRKVERKKYGRHKARRSTQFSKR